MRQDFSADLFIALRQLPGSLVSPLDRSRRRCKIHFQLRKISLLFSLLFFISTITTLNLIVFYLICINDASINCSSPQEIPNGLTHVTIDPNHRNWHQYTENPCSKLPKKTHPTDSTSSERLCATRCPSFEDCRGSHIWLVRRKSILKTQT